MAVTLHEGTTFLVSDDRGDIAPGKDGMTRLDLDDVSVGGARIDVSVVVEHGEAEVKRLPAGWRRVERRAHPT